MRPHRSGFFVFKVDFNEFGIFAFILINDIFSHKPGNTQFLEETILRVNALNCQIVSPFFHTYGKKVSTLWKKLRMVFHSMEKTAQLFHTVEKSFPHCGKLPAVRVRRSQDVEAVLTHCIGFGQPDEGVGSPLKTRILRIGAGTPSSRSRFALFHSAIPT